MADDVNFCISGVKYDSEETLIGIVKIHQNLDGEMSEAYYWFRDSVLNYIKAGYSIWTVYEENGQWQKGEQVIIDTVNGTEFIKTKQDDTPKDNLGNLDSL